MNEDIKDTSLSITHLVGATEKRATMKAKTCFNCVHYIKAEIGCKKHMHMGEEFELECIKDGKQGRCSDYESLCDSCSRADVSCPVFPQYTRKCVEHVGGRINKEQP